MRLRLPPKVKYIIETLESEGFEAFAVGGCVRDSILARTPSDWDITTSAIPAEIKSVFRRTVDTGIAHGTVTVLVGDEGFEVTTYRIDGKYEDGRHPSTVSFTPNLSEDLLRRDFTINAMAYSDRTGLVDLYGGMQDLQRKVIRCVGDADARLTEDALRILRAVRFSAQLDFRIEQETMRAVRDHAASLRRISAERIRVEIVKLITSQHPEKWMDLYELGITNVIMPEFDRCMQTPQHTPHHMYNVGEHIVHAMEASPDDRIVRLTMLLHDLGKAESRYTDSTGRDHFYGHAEKSAEIAEQIMRRLKFDNDTIGAVKKLVLYHDLRPKATPKAVRKAIHRIGADLFPSYLAVRWADTSAQSPYKREEKFAAIREVSDLYEEIIAAGQPLTLRDLAINGSDLLAMGAQGREIGEILEETLEAVLDDPDLNNRRFLREFARNRFLTKHAK